MAVQVILQPPFDVVFSTIPVSNVKHSFSKRRHALESSMHRHVLSTIRGRGSPLSGQKLDGLLADRANAFDAKLSLLFPRVFSTDRASPRSVACRFSLPGVRCSAVFDSCVVFHGLLVTFYSRDPSA